MTSSSGRTGDHFSTQAADYARYRPHYPERLFDYLASLTSSHASAWDCATGSSQAAVPLAAHFASVVATDISESQLRRAEQRAGVYYAVAAAGAAPLPPQSVDLVTVAQALHWLDLDDFYAEVRRVLRPRGVIAVSSYGSAELDDARLSAVLSEHEWGTVGPYWPPGRQFVGDGLRSLDFPFHELAPPPIPLTARWTLDELLGYVRSWSATARYVKETGRDPTADLAAALRPHWGVAGQQRTVRWPFVVRVGRLED